MTLWPEPCALCPVPCALSPSVHWAAMAQHLLIVCIVSVVVAVVVVLVLRFLGLGERAVVIAAAVSSGVASATTSVRLRSAARKA